MIFKHSWSWLRSAELVLDMRFYRPGSCCLKLVLLCFREHGLGLEVYSRLSAKAPLEDG